MSSVTETIQAGSFKEFFEPGDFFRLLATTGPVNVEFYYMGRETVDVQGVEAGYAEYFRGEGQSPFDRVRIYSATTQTVQFVTRNGSDVRYDRGASSVSGSVDLNNATIGKLQNIVVATASFKAKGVIAANTPELVFSAVSNVNGAWILSASCSDVTADVVRITLLSKATPPAGIDDGEVFMRGQITGSASTRYLSSSQIENYAYVPPGQALYFIADRATDGVDSSRICRYKLL